MFYVGTSGFAYKSWKGAFYPEKLPQKEFLDYYSQHFATTEINNTFYRSPSARILEEWSRKVPDPFRFTLKLNRRITHQKMLKEVDESMDWFLKGAAALGSKLGCILVQLPPWFRQDLERLRGFLETYADKAPMAVEFRNNSWFNQETYSLLEEYSFPMVVVEADDRTAERVVTGPFLYARLRKTSYQENELDEWAEWLLGQGLSGFVYFKHETLGVQLARALQQRLGSDAAARSL